MDPSNFTDKGGVRFSLQRCSLRWGTAPPPAPRLVLSRARPLRGTAVKSVPERNGAGSRGPRVHSGGSWFCPLGCSFHSAARGVPRPWFLLFSLCEGTLVSFRDQAARGSQQVGSGPGMSHDGPFLSASD